MTDLTTRAAALLAAADKMTPGEWWSFAGAVQVRGGPIITDSIDSPIGERQSLLNDAGIVALRNEAPALIRELLAENERWRDENNRLRLLVTANLSDITINERLRQRVAELEARLEIDPRHSYDGIDARDETIKLMDAGPSRFQGRTTRRE